ncbi:hypothetical protein IWW55_004455 [Coemansia sp. RSA 2706]|nr:hypothetical protein IWW55_004455 [Coemansia sp. RSA 2706]
MSLKLKRANDELQQPLAKRARVSSSAASTVTHTYSAGTTSATAPLPGGFPVPPAGCESQFRTWGQKWREVSGAKPASTCLMQCLVDFVTAVDNVAAAQVRLNFARGNICTDLQFLERVQASSSELANDMIKWAAKRVENANAALAKANQAKNKATQAKDKTKYAVDELLRSQRSIALGASPMPLTPPYSKSQAKSRKLSEKQPLPPAKANATRTAAIEHRRSNPSVASPPSHAITPRTDTKSKKPETEGSETADQLEGWKRLNGSLTIGQMLGEGRSGTVHRGKYNGRPAALKISFADAAPEIVEEMRNEVAVYEQLADLQGTDIPQLYDWGLADIDGFQCAVIVLEELTDVMFGIPEDDKAERLSMAERERAICALSRLHDWGIVHGDPRMDNLLFVPAASTSKCPRIRPVFIDFGFAEANADDKMVAEDYEGWCEVLQ